MSPRVVFRADASASIGFGHLSRVVTLAEAARAAGAEVAIVSANPDAAARAFAARVALDLTAIDEESGSAADAARTRAVAGAAACVVADGYGLGPAYLGELAGEHRVVAYVDDLARGAFTCDLVLNPNVSARAESYAGCSPGTELLLGPAYALVARAFVAARQERARREEPARARRVLVTMGGSDPPGATLGVLRAVAELGEAAARLEVRVVVGAANRRGPEIGELAARSGPAAVRVLGAVDDMASELRDADLVVTASGVTATEAACVGVPGVSFAIVDNQEAIATELAARGLYVVPARREGVLVDEVELGRAILSLAEDAPRRSAMVAAQRSTVDGQGPARVVARFLALSAVDRHTRRTERDGGERG